MQVDSGELFRKLVIIYLVSEHIGWHWLTLIHSSYADNLKFIKKNDYKKTSYYFR